MKNINFIDSHLRLSAESLTGVMGRKIRAPLSSSTPGHRLPSSESSSSRLKALRRWKMSSLTDSSRALPARSHLYAADKKDGWRKLFLHLINSHYWNNSTRRTFAAIIQASRAKSSQSNNADSQMAKAKTIFSLDHAALIIKIKSFTTDNRHLLAPFFLFNESPSFFVSHSELARVREFIWSTCRTDSVPDW